LLLAIDSSSGTSAALLALGGAAAGELRSLVIEPDPFGHAENIGNVILQALKDAGVTAGDISEVAVGRGPAPYTGLRVGMAAAVAFAKPRGLPLHGVIALDAVAQDLVASESVSPDTEFVVTSDAKRREFFERRYLASSPLVQAIGDPVVCAEVSADAFHNRCDAGMIARYAWQAQQGGRTLSDVSALYLRSPDVSPSPGKRVTG
jgi:tRNA threonylcarbamoyl adenosine modification protein YeaZ